jgi:hypothetical protein
MHKHTALIAFLVALVLVPLSGCWTTMDSKTHTIFGTHSEVVSGTPDQVIAAAREVVREMKLTEVSSRSSKMDGQLLATTATEKTVEILAESKGERMTNLSVRVGTGDKDLSYQLIEQIKNRL